MVTEEQIKENYTKFFEYLKDDSRIENIKKMYDAFGVRIVEAPASMRTYWHNCFPGGYIDHVVRVCETSVEVTRLFKKMGGTINFNKQELIFAALHHDLGKLGTPEYPYYLDQESDWHRKRGELYKMNDNVQYMRVTDRAAFLLQQFDIKLTENEWLAIKLSDGLYTEGNDPYLKTSHYPYAMHTNLPYIIHTADHLSATVERDQTRVNLEDESGI